jgi:hypothetical protein
MLAIIQAQSQGPAQSELRQCQKEKMDQDLQLDSDAAATSLEHVEWTECSFPFSFVSKHLDSQQDRDNFWFCVKLDRPARIVDIRLGRLNGGDISHVWSGRQP